MTPFKGFIVALAILCAIDSFYWQKKLLRGPRNPRMAAKSTPARRWMVGNVARLAFSIAVSGYGMVLHFVGGPESLVISLAAFGLVLLLIWRPGPMPID